MEIISILLSAAALVVSGYTYISNVKRNKQELTFKAFNELQEQVFDNLNKISRTKVLTRSENIHSEDYKTISVYMARIEHFAVGVNSKIYDIKIVKRLAGKYLIYNIYEKIKPMIDVKRGLNKSEKHYDEIDIMIEKLKGMYK